MKEKTVFSKILLLIAIVLLTQNFAWAADRYTVATGNWSSTSTWSDVSGGTPGASVPVAGDNVYVEGGYTVTLNANTASLNLLNIASGSTFVTSGTYTVTATTINVDGIYRNASSGAVTGTMTVNGRYQHAFTTTAGTVPTATWASGSICEFTGFTTAGSANPVIGGMGQAFSNLVWNCPNQSAQITLSAVTLSTTAGIKLSVVNTGSSNLALCQTAGILGSIDVSGGALYSAMTNSRTVTVTGDVNITGGNLTLASGSGIANLNVTGNLNISGGSMVLSSSTGAGNITLTGNANLTGGTVNMNGSTGTTTWNVAGNFTQSAANSFTRTSTGAGTVVFNGTAAQTLTLSNALPSGVNLTISNTTGVMLGANISGLSGTLRMNASAKLDLSTYNLVSTGTVYLYGASSLIQGTGSLTPGTSINSATGTVPTISCPVVLGSDCTFTGAGSAIISGIISGDYSITKTGTGTFTLKGANTYTGATNITAGAINIQNASALGSTGGVTAVSSGGALQLQGGITFNAEPLTIAGTGVSSTGALRNTGGTNNWTGTITLSADAMIYSGSGALSLTASNSITGTDYNVSFSGSYPTTVSGSITIGAGGLTKSGTGTLTLTGSNTYNGVTTITAGPVNIQNASALGSTTGGTVVSAGALYLQGGITYDPEPLTIAGTGVGSTGAIRNISGVNTWTGTVTMSSAALIYSSAGTLNLTATNAITGADYNLSIYTYPSSFINVNGVIAIGTGTVTKTGTGTCTFTAANTYSGATTVSAGVLNIQNAAALGTVDGATTVASGAALQLQGGVTFNAESLNLAGTGISSTGALRNVSGDNTWTGPITLTAATRIYSNTGTTLTINATNAITAAGFGLTAAGAGNTTITGVIATGSGSVTKNDAGTLTLTAANTYTGATSVVAGVLNIRNASALGSVSGVTTITSGATLQLQGGITYDAEPLTMAGSGVSTTGALRSISGDNTWTGLITMSAGSRITTDANTLTLNAANAITATNMALTVAGNGNTNISGTITTGTGALTKTGAGVLTLSGTNTYTGVTTISAGVVNIQNASALGTTAGYTIVSSGAALQVQGGLTVAEPLRLYGSGISNNGALRNLSGNNTWSGAVTQYAASLIYSDSGTLTFDVASGSSVTGGYALTFAGAGDFKVNDPIAIGGGTLTKNGSGTITLSAANTYTGVTTINTGRLEYGIANAIATGRIAFGGGTYSTGATTGYTDAVGTLTLTDNTVLALGTGSHTLTFANSSAVTWTSNTLLAVTGWTGTLGSSGTSGRLFFGNTSAGLTTAQLAQVMFLINGSYYSSKILSTGEVVPLAATNAISTGALSASGFCPGSGGVTVPFTYTIASNYVSSTFTAQLSDASGDFASPVVLGTVASDLSGSQSIIVTIPSSTPAGTGYRIRVVSDTPAITGFDNGTNLSVSELSAVSVSPAEDQTMCLAGSGVALSVTDVGGGLISHQWGKRSAPGGTVTDIYGATSDTYLPTGADLGEGVWYIVCTSESKCGAALVSSNEVKVVILSGSIWIGGTTGSETDWNTESNWCGGVPSATDNINIYSSSVNFPVVPASSTIECSNMTIEAGASLTIDAGGALTVDGNLINAGSLVINSSLASSGSLIVSGTASGTVTYNRQLRTESSYGDYHYFSSPVSSNTSDNSSKVTAVYGWDEVSGTWPTTTMTSLVSGIGYNLDQTSASDGNITFTGGMVNSLVSVSATSPYSDCSFDGIDYDARSYAPGRDYETNYGGGGWNLLGNPYTAALSASTFITDNESSFDPNYLAVYIYDGSIGTTGQYYYVTAGGTGWEGTYGYGNVQVGQGFFVLAMCNSSTFAFTPDMRVHAISVPMTKSTKTSGRWPGIKLTAKSATSESSTMVVYNNGMKPGLDPGYDIGQLSSGSGIEVYTSLVKDDGVNFACQALPVDGCDTLVVPVGVDLKAGGEVTFSAITGELAGYKYILEDRTTGILTDLSTSTYTVTLAANNLGTGRFFIHTKNTTTDINNPADNDQEAIRIWTYNGEIIIKGEVSSKAVVDVYDFRGDKILNDILTEGNYNTIPLSAVTKGAYVVRVTDGSRVVTRKIMIL
jgi:autotransporter-associated beta strand protein